MKNRLITIRLEGPKIILYNTANPARRILQCTASRPTVLPFLKWAGGKQWLAPLANLLIPPGFSSTYYEPFLGAGSFFFASEPNKGVLSDLNADLIGTYAAIKANVSVIIKILSKYPYDEDFYYYMRSKKAKTQISLAAKMLYLNRACWNGLYRVNSHGEFNVPFGRYSNPTICDVDRLLSAAQLLKRVDLLCCDFEQVAEKAQAGDFVYFDPPYITGHHNNGFLKYNSRLFSWNDQERLSKIAVTLRDRGVWVLISNANHLKVLKLYRDFYFYRIKRKSLIGGLGSTRGRITEALLSNYPLFGIPSEVL